MSSQVKEGKPLDISIRPTLTLNPNANHAAVQLVCYYTFRIIKQTFGLLSECLHRQKGTNPMIG